MKERKRSLRKPRVSIKCGNPECNNHFDIIENGHRPKQTCSRKCQDKLCSYIQKNRTKEQIDESTKKNKQTKLKKYGDENYRNVEKRKKTCKERYNDPNYNNRDKFKNTLDERYGGHHLKLPEFQEKQKSTHFKNYGVEYVLQVKGNREKAIQGIIKKYGVDNYGHTIEYRKQKREDQLKIIDRHLKGTNINLYEPELFERLNYSERNVIPLKFQCKICNYIFESGMIQNNNKPPICRKCFPIVKNSSIELFLENFLIENNILYKKNNRRIIKPFELDFYLPDFDLAIEANGNYYHSDYYGGKDMNYHLNKTKMTFDKKLSLFHIFEDEINKKPEIILSLFKKELKLIHITTLNNITISEVNNEIKEEFLILNNLDGNVETTHNIGLFINNQLVYLINFEEKDNNVFNLLTITEKLSIKLPETVFSLCLNYFINKYKPTKIETEYEIRLGGLNIENNIFYKNSFNFVEFTKPQYWFIIKNRNDKRYSPLLFNREQLLLEHPDFDKNITFEEIMFKLGYDKIWDCGSMIFELIP